MNEHKMTPKDFFIYLGTAVSLYVSVGSLLALLFAIINERFPDVLNHGYYYGSMSGEGATFAIATLIIVVPLYLGLSYLIRRDIALVPAKRDMAIRRWFIWFTLFIAGAAVVGDLVTLLYSFLQGEITPRFILKVVSVLVVAGGVFSYYLYDMRRDPASKPNMVLVTIAGLFVLASIVLGFTTFGSPMEQRDMRLDHQREMNLSDIQWQILNHWQTKQTLPASLTELGDDFSGYIPPVDPETEEMYEYTVTGPLSFDLCATFADSSDMRRHNSMAMPVEDFGIDSSFEHEAGRTCFSRTIDPVKYPPYQ